MSTATKVEQTVSKWGNGLAIRLTSKVEKAAHLAEGSPVTIEVKDDTIVIRRAGPVQTSLAQKLKMFDPNLHGGEAMASENLIGPERI